MIFKKIDEGLDKRMVMKKTMFFMILALALSVKATAGNEWQVNRIVHDGKNVYVGTENVGLIAIDKQSGGQTQYLHKWSDYAKGICDVSVHNGNVYYVTKYYKLVTLKDGEMTEEPINVPYAAPDRFLFPVWHGLLTVRCGHTTLTISSCIWEG